jgi:hypothetical protein
VRRRTRDWWDSGVPVAAIFATSAAVLPASVARAAEPDRGAAVLAGAATFVLAFAAGGIVVATANGGNLQSNVGWITIESGFALAPLASHAVVGEWARGLAFTATPAAMLGGSVALFDYDNGTILHGSLTEQRIMWGLFTAGLFAGIVGVVDAGLGRATGGSVALAPLVGHGETGLTLGGAL